MGLRGLAKRLATRRLRTGTLLVAALLALGVVAWNASPPDSLIASRESAAADRELKNAVRATRAQNTGAFAIHPFGVEGSFDQAAGTFQVDYDFYDPEEDADFVDRRIVVEGTVYVESDYSKGDECWFDLTGVSHAGYGDRGPEVALLVDSLRGVSGAGHTIEATVPVGRLADAFVGSDLFEKHSGGAGSPGALRVPVTVRIGVDAVQTIVVDMDAVRSTLNAQDVDVEDAFGEGIDTEFLADQDEVRIVLSRFGFPVTIERPSPFDIGIHEDDTC